MQRSFPLHSYSARLVSGIVVLVLITTLSAGVPAYWLTRTELQAQTRARMNAAERSTRSLLLAERERLENLLTLLTERPTLLSLVREDAPGELAAYLDAFERQSSLNSLTVCSLDDSSPAANTFIAPCPDPIATGFVLVESEPAIVTALPVNGGQANGQNVMAIAAVSIDEPFLQQLASNTGAAQSVLLLGGARLASTVSRAGTTLSGNGQSLGTRIRPPGLPVVQFGGQQFYADQLMLTADDDQPTFVLEIALPVDELIATERRSLGILILSTGLVSLLGTVIGIWTVRRLTNPLERLTDTAEAIGAGDLTASVPVLSGPSEVRTLAAALRRSQASMLAALDGLAETRDWLDNLVQSIVEGVLTMDDEGHVTFINQKTASLASIEPEDAIGRHVDDLLAAADETGNRISLQGLSTSGRYRITLIRDADDGASAVHYPGQRTVRRLGRTPSAAREPVAFLDVTAIRLHSPDKEKMQTALILRDVTEEEALRHLRSYFLANITHEFRTPLSTLNASIELLMEEDDLNAAEMRELLKPIHLSLVNLQTLIDNLLESSSIEAGHFAIRKQQIELEEVIVAALHMVQPFIERREQTLSITEPLYLPPVQGDAARLTQVLVNLLSNASKYAPPDTAIDLVVEQRDRTLHVAVADRGMGVPAKERAKLFQRFVRLQGYGAEQYGVGLGLYVVKTTVEAHGGSVGVDERPEGGSVFWFELPLEDEETL